ncbi:uncharacterized protein LOC135197085 [Macrobrachium nipponense]|uniref:uncharacterized protein LOC135197085 n=1 Tax=Macrobrachium nipponense TaxID=159736 RepID=UPI0030C87DEF
MFWTTTVFAVILAFASANPEPNLFEQVITDELRKLLTPYDPYTFPTIPNLNITHDDTSLLFNFVEDTFTGFSGVECTQFSPPIFTKQVVLTLNEERVDMHASNYQVEGLLNGQPLSATGVADLVAHNLGVSFKFQADSYTLSPLSLCVAAGSLNLDFRVESLNSNFENAEELNHEIDSRGPELIEILQDYVMLYAEDIVTFLNSHLCKP